MRYKIIHTTTYHYSKRVELEPHIIRLRSRSCVFQTLDNFSLEITPQPTGISEILDWEGNSIIKAWFNQPTEKLHLKAISDVETHCLNPFNYLLEPWAITLPIIDYPQSMLTHLQPYLQHSGDPISVQLAQEISHKVNGQIVLFLSELNNLIYRTCTYTVREIGEPYPPSITWKKQLGSCRDLAVLFMDTCRAIGLASRFVSGYQEGDPDNDERHLHGWAEVYLPGAGWRGFDPSHGLAVSDRHIILAASAHPRYAAPISGNFRGVGAQSNIEYTLSIQSI
jgi:transglutaminase-like putative cysteine protease